MPLLDEAALAAMRQWKFAPRGTSELPIVLAVSVWMPADQLDEHPVRGGIREPERLNHVEPVYAPIAEAAKLEGVVILYGVARSVVMTLTLNFSMK